jgi:glycosyltransferase involved in cell wall biosynthesis
MSSPAVSVIIPAYNAARYLESAIASIQAQTFSDFEIIAVDDGSTDETKIILERLAARDQRIRVISRPNTGIVGALNDALAAARGKLIARMDGDDLALPTRFETQIAFLDAHPECVALGTAVQIIDSRTAIVDRYDPPLDHDAILAELLRGNGGALIHPSAVFRADALRSVNGYGPEFCKAEDLDLYLRLSHRGRLANLPSLGLQYRHHLASTNFKHRDIQRDLIARILDREFRLRQLPAVVPHTTGHSDLSRGRLHARWACTALRHGRRRTALRHGFSAVFHEPRDRHCWSALKYALFAPAAP